ncbi:MAG: Crp/Fnr family transcriptional regulator, partial [Acidimicrobiales bacterium]
MVNAVTADTEHTRRQFDAVPLFAMMSSDTRDRLWGQARLRGAQRGDVVVAQGSSTDRLNVLLAGEATSVHATVSGRTVALAGWVGPAIIDKVAVFTEARHPASVLADTQIAYCTLPLASLRTALEANPAAQQHAFAAVANAAMAARESFVDSAIRSSTARIARWILATHSDGSVRLPRPQERLALQLGMTRVTFNR